MAHHQVTNDYMAHGFCFSWEPGLVRLHVVSDIATGIAYYAIAFAMLYYACKRRGITYYGMLISFAAFILACGTTHFFAAYTIYDPVYWQEGYVKAFTAVISIASAIYFIPQIPKALTMPSLAKSLAENRELNTQLTRTVQALQESNALNQSIIDSSTDCIKLLDPEGRLQYVSPEGQRRLGIKNLDEFLNMPYENFWHGKDRDAARAAVANARQGHHGSFEGYCPAQDGTPKWWEVIVTPVKGEAGNPEKLLAVLRDITEHKSMEENLHNQTLQLEEELAERQMAQESLQEQAAMLEEEVEERRKTEEALQRSEDTVRNKLRAILEPEGDIGALELSEIIDCEMLQSMLEDFYRITGMLGAVLDVSGKVLVAVGWQDICTKFHRCHPDTLKNCIESDINLTTGVPVGTFKHYRCKNNLWDMVTPLVVGGKHVGNVFIGQFFYEDEVPDVELFREQARRYGFDEAEYLAALDRVPRFSREAADAGMKFYAKLTSMVSSLSFSSIKVSRMLNERIHLEEQLRQSQKMEAVGQLAGGVAHDFNNILQVISGYGNMLKMDGKLDDRQQGEIDHILAASEKAAQLTKGLLAFSRKQVMALAPVNLNDIIENVKKFLARIIGEDIQLKTLTCENRLKIYADWGQIEQVLINLATNARDAMQKGGLLTIETGFQTVEASTDHESGRAEPGSYAVMTVSDTGIGMDKETCKKIFEPFYTTKEIGKGTGLGMAIVYGIVKQHNGFIDVYSEPGQGTTFRIYLPIHGIEQSGQAETIVPVAPPRGGTETILVAEDDVDVRNLVVSLLTRFGYDVIQAVDGQDVVDKFTEHRDRIAMILMDMIMPKKNGKEAYEEIALLKPDVKVLYSSGYTADFILNRGVSGEDIELIMKPVQPMELLRRIREILDL